MISRSLRLESFVKIGWRGWRLLRYLTILLNSPWQRHRIVNTFCWHPFQKVYKVIITSNLLRHTGWRWNSCISIRSLHYFNISCDKAFAVTLELSYHEFPYSFPVLSPFNSAVPSLCNVFRSALTHSKIGVNRPLWNGCVSGKSRFEETCFTKDKIVH